MSSSYLNMAAGAFLGTCFVAMTLSIVSGAIYYSPNPEKEGFVIKGITPSEGGAAAAAKPQVPPIAPLLQKADAKKGAQIFKKCEACHTGEKGGPNKIGPDLWNIVDRPIAEHEGFSYSAALKKFSDGGKNKWTYERLNHWLHDPRGYVSGTAMTFPGVKEDQDRADVIAYLHTLSDSPVPFPKPEAPKSDKAASADKGAAPADKGAAPAGKGAAPTNGMAPKDSGAGPAKATGDQSSKPGTPPAAQPPAKTDGNSGSTDQNQKATGQNPQSQGANQQGAPATQKPPANQ